MQIGEIYPSDLLFGSPFDFLWKLARKIANIDHMNEGYLTTSPKCKQVSKHPDSNQMAAGVLGWPEL